MRGNGETGELIAKKWFGQEEAHSSLLIADSRNEVKWRIGETGKQ